MDRRFGVHGMKEGNVIDASPNVWEQVRHPFAALAVLFELPLRPDCPALILVPAPAKGLDRNRLPIERIKRGLVVERVDVAGPAVAEDEDHRLRLAGKVRLLW